MKPPSLDCSHIGGTLLNGHGDDLPTGADGHPYMLGWIVDRQLTIWRWEEYDSQGGDLGSVLGDRHLRPRDDP